MHFCTRTLNNFKSLLTFKAAIRLYRARQTRVFRMNPAHFQIKIKTGVLPCPSFFTEQTQLLQVSVLIDFRFPWLASCLRYTLRGVQSPGAQANGVAGFWKLLPHIVCAGLCSLITSTNTHTIVHDGVQSKGKLLSWGCLQKDKQVRLDKMTYGLCFCASYKSSVLRFHTKELGIFNSFCIYS